MCSEANQIPELERRTRCPLHASKTKTKEKIDTTTKEECKSASITDSFIPDYVGIVSSIAPLQDIMKCGEKDFDIEARKNIPGLRLLKIRKMRQEEKEFMSKSTSTKGKKKKRMSFHGMWREAFSKASL